VFRFARRRFTICAVFLVSIFSTAAAWASQVDEQALSNNAIEDSRPFVSGNRVAWQRGERDQSEIQLWDGLGTTPLTSNSVWDYDLWMSGDSVIWKRTTNGISCDLYWYDGNNTAEIGDSFSCDGEIRVAGDHLVWPGAGPALVPDIFLYSGGDIDEYGDELREEEQPRVGDVGGMPYAVWVNGDGFFYFDGSGDPDEIASGDMSDPVMDGMHAAWVEDDGNDDEIWYTDGTTTTQLTNNSWDDRAPAIYGSNVVWISEEDSDTEIMHWNGSVTVRITDDSDDDDSPQVSGGVFGLTMAWIKESGGNRDLWMNEGCESSQITDTAADEFSPALDGQRVAWVRGVDEGAEVYTALVTCDVVCGDGVQEGIEGCDDGNTAPGDGCDESCILEVCGNGVLQDGEECDDGNTAPGDGCDGGCFLQCGNGVIDAAAEECDDGNRVSGDGCDEFCLEEVCGNGRQEANEECDDGNTVGGDGCDPGCLIECGNGVVDPGEDCDDGNLVPGDGCDATCVAEVCGNGILQEGEICDDGNTLGGDGCSPICEPEAPPSKAQQKCIVELNKRGANLVKSQNKASQSCLKSALKGKVDKLGVPATAQACLTNDAKGKIAKGSSKTVSGESKKCDPADLPLFGYTSSATVNAAAVAEPVAMMTDVFGGDLDAAVAAATDGGKCQNEVAKRSAALVDFLFKAANKEKKSILKGKSDGSTALSSQALQAAVIGYIELDPKAKVAKKESQLLGGTASKCAGLAIAAHFPGCASADELLLAACAQQSARCRFCRALNDFDALATDCDDFDDELANASCP